MGNRVEDVWFLQPFHFLVIRYYEGWWRMGWFGWIL